MPENNQQYVASSACVFCDQHVPSGGQILLQHATVHGDCWVLPGPWVGVACPDVMECMVRALRRLVGGTLGTTQRTMYQFALQAALQSVNDVDDPRGWLRLEM